MFLANLVNGANLSFSISPQFFVSGNPTNAPTPSINASTWTFTFDLPSNPYTSIPPVAVGINPTSGSLTISGSGNVGIDGVYTLNPSSWVLAPEQAGSNGSVLFKTNTPFSINGSNNTVQDINLVAFLGSGIDQVAGNLASTSHFLGALFSSSSEFVINVNGNLETYSPADGATVVPEPSHFVVLAGLCVLAFTAYRRLRSTRA